MYKYIFLILIIIFAIIEIRSCYNTYINKYFRCSNNNIVYDHLIKFIHVVSKNNYYMNYGLWDDPNMMLEEANIKLVNFIYKNANLNAKDTFKILDVGCGYGKQDILWSKNISSKSKITAVDISKLQIKYANKFRKAENISRKRLNFKECDAHELVSQLPGKRFNRIISLETAFHYKDRNLFFNNVSKLLTSDGLFIISDIMLQDTEKRENILTNGFIKLSSDFLSIPETNLITMSEWKINVENSGLKIVNFYNIADKTFLPYYHYFFKTYIKNIDLPDFISSILCKFTDNIQPFCYVVAVCKLQ